MKPTTELQSDTSETIEKPKLIPFVVHEDHFSTQVDDDKSSTLQSSEQLRSTSSDKSNEINNQTQDQQTSLDSDQIAKLSSHNMDTSESIDEKEGKVREIVNDICEFSLSMALPWNSNFNIFV